jgi:hypothetical protein
VLALPALVGLLLGVSAGTLLRRRRIEFAQSMTLSSESRSLYAGLPCWRFRCYLTLGWCYSSQVGTSKIFRPL